jgi:hypothetical protein
MQFTRKESPTQRSVSLARACDLQGLSSKTIRNEAMFWYHVLAWLWFRLRKSRKEQCLLDYCISERYFNPHCAHPNDKEKTVRWAHAERIDQFIQYSVLHSHISLSMGRHWNTVIQLNRIIYSSYEKSNYHFQLLMTGSNSLFNSIT